MFLAVIMNKKEEFGTRVVPNSSFFVLASNGSAFELNNLNFALLTKSNFFEIADVRLRHFFA